jgi:hypothetical protein
MKVPIGALGIDDVTYSQHVYNVSFRHTYIYPRITFPHTEVNTTAHMEENGWNK